MIPNPEQIEELKRRFAKNNEPTPGNSKMKATLDVARYLDHYGVMHSVKHIGPATLYVLDLCLFDSSHDRGEATIIQMQGGTLLYRCFHNSCQGKKWADARKEISGNDSLKDFLDGGNGSFRSQEKKDSSDNEGGSLVTVDAAELLLTEPPTPDQILTDVFDMGDKLAIIASSKLRKSFFLLQALLCLATGRHFMTWNVPKTRRILYIQFEIQPHHLHRRVLRMARAMNIAPEDLSDRFQIINARGFGLLGSEAIEKIREIASNLLPEVICFDPLYKIAIGAENAAEDLKSILNGFDKLADTTGAAIIYVHHDAKGSAGDRDVRDRGAGSNVLGRDYDAAITLTAHVSEEDAVVVETLLRNYRPQDPFTAVWNEDPDSRAYRFDHDETIVPTKKTSANGKAQNILPFETYLPAAAEILSEKVLPIGVFLGLFRAKTGITVKRAGAFVKWATDETARRLDIIEQRSRGAHVKLIGLPDQIYRAKMREERQHE